MDLLNVVGQLRETPEKFLESVSPVYLDALIHGYGTVDRRAFGMLQALSLPVGPTASLGVCTRMYLAEPDATRGVAILLEKFENFLRASPREEPVRQSFAGRSFASVVGEVVKKQRPALLFREPTVSWVFHFSVGFNLAFEEVDSGAARADREQLACFGEWLQRRYGWQASVPWHRLIRVYEGEDFQGLTSFVRLWDEFVAGAPVA
jgi:hypothetical protein